MLKINVSFSKKIPGEEQYSSLNFHGSLERELSDGLSSADIQRIFHENYQLLEQTVEQEIQTYSKPAQPQQSFPPQQSPQAMPASPSSNQASPKQIQFLNRLGAERGLSQSQVDALALNNYNVDSIWKLNKKQASQLIDQMQNQRAA